MMELGAGSLMGAAGLGGAMGVVTLLIKFFVYIRMMKMEQERERQVHDLEKFRLASTNDNAKIQEFNKPPTEFEMDNNIKRTLTLNGKVYAYEKTQKKDKLVYGIASLVHGCVLLLLSITLCWCVLIWADNPQIPVVTLNPAAEPIKLGFLGLFELSIPKNSLVQITTFGGAFVLLHPIVSIVGYVVVGAGGDALAKKIFNR